MPNPKEGKKRDQIKEIAKFETISDAKEAPKVDCRTRSPTMGPVYLQDQTVTHQPQLTHTIKLLTKPLKSKPKRTLLCIKS